MASQGQSSLQILMYFQEQYDKAPMGPLKEGWEKRLLELLQGTSSTTTEDSAGAVASTSGEVGQLLCCYPSCKWYKKPLSTRYFARIHRERCKCKPHYAVPVGPVGPVGPVETVKDDSEEAEEDSEASGSEEEGVGE
jgi:hypothetical protein